MQNIPNGTKFPEGQPEYVFTVTYDIGGQHGRYPPNILIGEVSLGARGRPTRWTPMCRSVPRWTSPRWSSSWSCRSPTEDATP